MLNKRALETIRRSNEVFSVSQLCLEHDYSHDGSIALLGWMFGLAHMTIPNVKPLKEPPSLSDIDAVDYFIHRVNGQYSANKCLDEEDWPLQVCASLYFAIFPNYAFLLI